MKMKEEKENLLLDREDNIKVFTRRSLLKGSLFAGAFSLAAQACTKKPKPEKLIPYLVPPENIVPGEAVWYATSCNECPASCGILVRNVDGRAIKVEGNPDHPINEGRLCPRGHASLQGLYNPDRIRTPLIKDGARFREIDWEGGEKIFSEKIKASSPSKVWILTESLTSTRKILWDKFKSDFSIPYENHIEIELSFEHIREATKIVFGKDVIPV